jgi:hypothetical protein
MYENAIDESLTNSEKRWDKHVDRVSAINSEYMKRAERWEKLMVDIFAQDTLDYQKEQEDVARKQRKLAEKMAGFGNIGVDMPELKMPGIGEIEVKVPEVKMPEVKVPEQALPGREGQFKVISLRRFSFEPIEKMADALQKKQVAGDRKLSFEPVSATRPSATEVHDPEVVKRLDTLIEIMRGKQPAAVLAR